MLVLMRTMGPAVGKCRRQDDPSQPDELSNDTFLCLHSQIGVLRRYVFGLSVHECFSVCVLLARYFTNQWTKFHQTLVDDVVEGRDELIRF